MLKICKISFKALTHAFLLSLPSLHLSSAQETDFKKVGDFIYNSVKLPETKDLIIEKFGKPDSLIFEALENKYDSTSVDTIYHFYYSGFKFETYCLAKTKKCFLIVFILNSNSFSLPFDIELGMGKTDIKNIFGKPIWVENEVLGYNDDGELVSHLLFFFDGSDKLIKIAWYHEE